MDRKKRKRWKNAGVGAADATKNPTRRRTHFRAGNGARRDRHRTFWRCRIRRFRLPPFAARPLTPVNQFARTAARSALSGVLLLLPTSSTCCRFRPAFDGGLTNRGKTRGKKQTPIATMPGLVEQCTQHFATADLYSVLGVQKTCTEADSELLTARRLLCTRPTLSDPEL